MKQIDEYTFIDIDEEETKGWSNMDWINYGRRKRKFLDDMMIRETIPNRNAFHWNTRNKCCSFKWGDNMPEDWYVDIYDGGAISEDGKLLLKYPKEYDILSNKKIAAECLKALGKFVNDPKIEFYMSAYDIKFDTIFLLCSQGYWDTYLYEVLIDNTNMEFERIKKEKNKTKNKKK